MGIFGALFGNAGTVRAVGEVATGVAEVFTENRTRAMERAVDVRMAAMAEHGAEFAAGGEGWWNAFCNGLNRLPRPMLALGTLSLFGYAMADPAGFTTRMLGLSHVPEPLWWLLGAVVSFYFGAREAHYFRDRRARGLPTAVLAEVAAVTTDAAPDTAEVPPELPSEDPPKPAAGATVPAVPGDNPALAQWLAG